MTIQVGEKLPSVELQTMGDNGVETFNSDEFFAGKRVVLFALPGAFTPTCSAHHLPGYNIHADALFARGIDTIACLSVNDAFVMDAWGNDQNVENNVRMIADGSAVFTEAVGLQMDLTARGMGLRSQRYAMVVNDGIVEQLNVEAAGKFEVSDAETILGSL